MYPLDPMGDRPDYQQQKLQHRREPGDGSGVLWMLGVMVGTLGVLAVISAI